MVTNTSSQLSSLAQTLETFIKAQTSSKDPQGVNGGGTSSPPASPVLNENIIRSSNGVKTRILEETVPVSMESLHAANLEITRRSEPTTEHFGISGAAKWNLNKMVAELGFDPMSPPPPETENSPTEQTAMTTMKPIEKLEVVKEPLNFYENIVCADLESLITPQGKNHVYMAAWYNGTKQNIFDITQWGNNTKTMLEMFWQDLIKNNRGRICYFHNFGGYDAILSLPALLHLPYTFSPIMKDGEIISIKVYGSKKRLLLTIKDSIKVLPGALGKLAKIKGTPPTLSLPVLEVAFLTPFLTLALEAYSFLSTSPLS